MTVAEEDKGPLVEVWATEAGVRHRVYRGRNPRHIAWKLEYHKLHQPEKILVTSKEK